MSSARSCRRAGAGRAISAHGVLLRWRSAGQVVVVDSAPHRIAAEVGVGRRPNRAPPRNRSGGNGDRAEVGRGERGGDLGVCPCRERQQRLADGGVVEDAAVDQAPLQGDGALHVRAAVVHGLGDRQQSLVDRVRGGVVTCLAGLDEVDEQLGGDVAVTDDCLLYTSPSPRD